MGQRLKAGTRIAVAVAVAVGLGAAATTHAAGPAHPGAQPGEAFTFKFSIGPIEGGRARMSVGRPVTRGAQRVIAVHGQAETTSIIKLFARMDDDYRLWVDTANLVPVSVSEVERGVREQRTRSTIAGRVADVDFWSPAKQLHARHTLGRLARDPLSGFFALRTLPLTEGQKVELDVLDGHALWRVALTAHRGQALRLGETAARPAIRIDGVARRIDDGGRPRPTPPPRTLTIWLSDDPERVLLRLEADTELGRCTLELTSYDAPPRLAAAKAPSLPGVDVR